jgi:hypothetical protein
VYKNNNKQNKLYFVDVPKYSKEFIKNVYNACKTNGTVLDPKYNLNNV